MRVTARRSGGIPHDQGCQPAGLVRPEFEYEIPSADADELLAMCDQPLIEKRRHLVVHEGHTWEVDEFFGANAGLFVA